ncbi:MAG: ankyrin repeat domain-containing protein [Bacteroidota bacterium]|nr:ankyrin repeat domain-containing protein [Bacteroidota bacterium]
MEQKFSLRTILRESLSESIDIATVEDISKKVLADVENANGNLIDGWISKKEHLPFVYISTFHNAAIAVRQLIDRGANVNVSTSTGETPLIRACMQNNLKIVKLLVEAGANINARMHSNINYDKADIFNLDEGGNSALMAAVNNDFGNTALVKYLLNNNADIGIITPYEKRNVLMEYVTNGFNTNESEIIPLLLAHGIDPNATDKNGSTALDLCSGLGFTNFVNVLSNLSAKQNKA